MNYDQKQPLKKQKMLHKFAHIFAAFLIALSCLSFAKTSNAQDITTGLVGHWTMDETSGTTLRDISATGVDGTMQNGLDGTSTVAGIVGTAINFAGPGSNEIIDIPNNAAYNADTFTMAFWIKTTQSCGGVSSFNCPGIIRKIAGNPPSSSDSGWFINTARNSGGVAFVWYDGATSDYTSSADINDNEWHHVTVVKTATEIRIYIDGFITKIDTYTGGSVINTEDIVIGNGTASVTANSFTGALDDIRFYNRALSSGDIQTLVEVSGQALEIPGYFVMIGNRPTDDETNEFTGDLGGIEGANQICMNYLTNYNWLGKDDALQADMIKPENVKAWLCDDDGCQNMLPNTEYRFAKTEAGEENTGGASFTTDANGFYPSTDTNSWDGSSYFARDTFFWTGREANNTNTAGTNIDCNNFTATVNTGLHGRTSLTGTDRWSVGTAGCSTTDQFVCFVNPAPNHKVCNDAHAGKMIYNNNYRVMQYCDGTEWINMGKESSLLHGQKTSGEDFDMNAVYFNGSQHLSINTTSVADSKKFTTSFWIKPYVTSGLVDIGGRLYEHRYRIWNGSLRVDDNSSSPSPSDYLDIESDALLNNTNWNHVIVSVDMSDPAKRHIYINDVEAFGTANNYIDGPLDFPATFYLGGRDNIGRSEQDLADFWFESDLYIDLSVEANRRKFINADGSAVFLGTDGSLPTGSTPDLFFSGDTANWHINKGTVSGGAVSSALATVAPPQHEYQKKLVGWWKLDEASGTTAYDSSGNDNHANITGGVTVGESGPVNGAFEFDGVNGCLRTINPISSEYMRDSATVSYWARVRTQEDLDTFIADSGGNYNNHMRNTFTWRIQMDDVANDGFPYNIDHATGSGTVLQDEWAHYVHVYDRNNSRMYRNGVIYSTSSAPVISRQYFQPSRYWFGCDRNIGNRSIDGFMDDIRVYNYALSAAEISELYNASSDILSYVPNAVNLAGVEPQRIRNNCCSDTNGTSFTGSFWIRFTNWPGHNQYIMDSNGENRIYFDTDGDMFFYFRSPASEDRVVLTANTDLLNNNSWHHIIYSFDVTNPANSYVYLDDVAVSLDNTTTSGTINFNTTNFTVLGPRNGNTNVLYADVADFWFDYNTYIDLSVEANRRDFIDANGYAVDLGADGSLPTGSTPTIFLTSDAAALGTNSGSGNDFSLAEGTFSDVEGPSGSGMIPRYCANPAEPEGTMIFNSDEYVMQYCDGNSWIPLGPPGNGGSFCNPPFAYAGSLIFNTTYKTMQYCEGDEWVGIGKDTREDVLAAGLIGHWRLDETSGTVANDSSGNNFHGNYINTPVPATGIVSGALDFQEADRDGVEITGTNFGRPLNFTISGWVDVDSLDTAGGTLLNVLGRGRVEIYPTYIEGSYESAGAVQNRTQYNTSLIGTGWRHITYVMDYNENWQRLYLDGSPVANTFFSTPVNWGTSTTSRIGRHISDSSNFDIDGRLDDVKLFNRVLSPSEVQEMYSASLSNLPSSDWKFVSSGRYYTCGIKTDDTGHCWGYNVYGQLGNNSTASIPKPSPISGGYSWSYLSAGSSHSCGILTNGDGYCWGDEQDGSLGNGSPDADTLVPVPISGGHKWTVIEAAGADDHTCGIADTQIGYCWGDGYGYTLGESGFTDRHTPNIIPDGYNWVDIDTGFWFGCGVTTEASNNGRCWGAGNNGRLGYGGGNSRNWPNRVSGGHTWLQISNGDYNHGCGIIADGRAKCWGYNYYGQVGDGTNTERLGTTFVSGGHTFTQVTTGYYHSCGIRTDGVTMCWGYNALGNLGDGTTTNSNVPVVVSGGHTFTSISAGGYHTCGIRTDNKMYCWGRGTNGQLGTWRTQNSSIPVEVK